MKKTFLILAFIAAGAITLIYSCKKSSNPNKVDPPGNSSSSIMQLFDQLKYTPQEFTVMSGRDTFIMGKDSTVLHIYPNSFKDAANNVITGQLMYVQLTEMYSGGDMIANLATTVAGDTLLQSGGEVKVIALNLSYQAVNIRPYGIYFKQSGPSAQPMHLYYGNNNNADSAIYWTTSDTTKPGTTASGTQKVDTICHYLNLNYCNFYAFDSCTNVGFVNCDYFHCYLSDTSTNIYITMTDSSFNIRYTRVFLYFPAINSNLYLYAYNTDTFSLVEGNIAGVPLNLTYNCIVVAIKGNNYYYYQTSGTTYKNLTISASMTQTTFANIQTQLKGM